MFSFIPPKKTSSYSKTQFESDFSGIDDSSRNELVTSLQ